METKLTGFRDFYGFIRTIQNPDLERNAYFLPPAMKDIIEDPESFVAIGENAGVILVHDDSLYRLYYFARNREAFKEFPILLKDKIGKLPIVCDVIREGEDKCLIEKLGEAGLRYYTTFIHFHCDQIPGVPENIDLHDIGYAEGADAITIRDLILSTFDIWSAHFPSIQEIESTIASKSIYAVHDKGKLVAFAWYDNQGRSSSILRFVIVDADYRGHGFGQKMFYKKLTDSPQTKYYELWVEDKNTLGQHQHKKNGYVLDEKIDYIFKI